MSRTYYVFSTPFPLIWGRKKRCGVVSGEVLPHVPDAKAFFEEDLGKKNPVIKTGAEIPFTRYFYKYQAPASSDELAKRFNELEASVDSRIKKLFGGN